MKLTIIALAILLSGCASKAGRELKSPCGPMEGGAAAYADCGPERPVNDGQAALSNLVGE